MTIDAEIASLRSRIEALEGALTRLLEPPAPTVLPPAEPAPPIEHPSGLSTDG